MLIRVGFPGFTLATLDALETHLFESDTKAMTPALGQTLKQQTSLVRALMSRRKGRHANGTLPVAAKVDPRLTRKRLRETSKGPAAAVKAEANAAVDTAVDACLGHY